MENKGAKGSRRVRLSRWARTGRVDGWVRKMVSRWQRQWLFVFVFVVLFRFRFRFRFLFLFLFHFEDGHGGRLMCIISRAVAILVESRPEGKPHGHASAQTSNHVNSKNKSGAWAAAASPVSVRPRFRVGFWDRNWEPVIACT